MTWCWGEVPSRVIAPERRVEDTAQEVCRPFQSQDCCPQDVGEIFQGRDLVFTLLDVHHEVSCAKRVPSIC